MVGGWSLSLHALSKMLRNTEAVLSLMLPFIHKVCTLHTDKISSTDIFIDVMPASYLRSCILRVITWWTSCSISATVASGASVTQDRGTGFHLPTWMRPEHTHTHVKNLRKRWTCVIECMCPFVWCTFGLCSRAVWVAQCQQGHLYQLVKQQISLDQHKLSVFFFPLSLLRAFLVLHHTEHRQQAPWGDGKDSYWTYQMPRGSHNHCTENITFQPIPLLCQLLLSGLTAVGFRQGFLAKGLPWLLLSWAEGPAPFCSSRASLAGGGRGSKTESLPPSGFLAPLHRASICGLTLIQRHKCLKINQWMR